MGQQTASQASGWEDQRANQRAVRQANQRATRRVNQRATRRGRPIFVEIRIRAPLERIWELTQNPELHPRWDLRFSSITPTDTLEGGGYRFRYERSLGIHTIVGTGTSLGERERPDGTRTSALRFDTNDPLSPLGDGRGYWRYTPGLDEIGPFVTFTTGYDYVPGWGTLGRILDPWLTRPLIGWMTAWSFDRLRMWAETDAAPDLWPLTTVVALWRGGRPRAGRCTRRAPGRRIMAEAPSTLDLLEEA